MLLPRPGSIRVDDDQFLITESTRICAPPDLRCVAEWLRAALHPATGFPLPIEMSDGSAPAIALSVDERVPSQAYRIVSGARGVSVTGGDAAGAFYGCQSLLQLLPAGVYRRARADGARWSVPGVEIDDSPAFTWRGVMLDVARHFMPKHDLLRFIDLIAMHKFNVLHLHLTDDQGWRVQIRRYPRLTDVGGWRSESQLGAGPESSTDGRPHGGYYTQDDIREIVTYAGARFVTVLPEIELPGHARSAIAAYPELGVSGSQLDVSTRWGIERNVLNVEDSTVQFFRNVFDEIVELFPGKVIGLGGDECPKDQWRADPRTQQLMRERGLATEDDLQAWFVGRIGAHLQSHGRRSFGWDELLDGPLPRDAVIGSWRGMAGAVSAARKGIDVVACPDDRVYLDYRQSELPDEPIPVAIPLILERVYGFDPVPAELTAQEATHVLGGQANIWTEHMDSARVVDYFAFPRLCAVAEALWSTGERDFGEFNDRLTRHLQRLDAIGVEYRPPGGPRPWQTRPGIAGRPMSPATRNAHIR